MVRRFKGEKRKVDSGVAWPGGGYWRMNYLGEDFALTLHCLRLPLSLRAPHSSSRLSGLSRSCQTAFPVQKTMGASCC